MRLQLILTALLGCVLSGPPVHAFQVAQHPPAEKAGGADAAASEHHHPDQGWLSPARYTNGFFGFTYELPPEAALQPIPEPVATDGQIQLLQLAGPPPADPSVTISAIPSPLLSPPNAKSPGSQSAEGEAAPDEKRDKDRKDRAEGSDARRLLRKQLDQELFIGVEELQALTRRKIAGRDFYWFETRRGIDQHAVLAADVNGYVLLVTLAARDDKMLKQLKTAFDNVQFFPPAAAAQYAGPDARPYDGPSISAHRLEALEADPPVKHMDPGETKAGVYTNRQLGLEYPLPAGWQLNREGMVQQAVIRSREQNMGKPALGPVEQKLMRLCERTLFSAWKKLPGPEGLSYEDFGEITVSETALSCFPAVSFPKGNATAEQVKDFLLHYGITHPLLRDMSQIRAFHADDHVLIVMQGVIAYQMPAESLSRRLSVALAVTEQRGFLLSWLYAAPHDSELRDLMKISIKLAPNTPPETMQAQTGKQELPRGGASDRPSSVAGVPTRPAASVQNADQPSETNKPDTSNTDTFHPTLLRPGETMDSHKMEGSPMPQKGKQH